MIDTASHTKTPSPNQASIRKDIRRRRLQLSNKQRIKASNDGFKQLNLSHLLLRHQHIAAYIADRGEIAPDLFFKTLWARKKILYLPVLHPFQKNKMLFLRYRHNETLYKNKFGIPEPKLILKNIARTRFLGLVLTPLVAFDGNCQRIGMGGGFYDRSFHFKRGTNAYSRPQLVGFAHDFQKVEHIATQEWDVPLNAVVTDKQTYLPRKNS
jgi:5-formyltetrahydrofolate cyclo-ligase